jgi:hypothetical protein
MIPDRAQEEIFDPDTARRLKQAIELLERYDRHLIRQDLVDHEGLLAEAVSHVHLLPHRLLIIEGYFEPWEAEQNFFDTILNHIPEAVVIVPADPLALKGERFFTRYNLVQRSTPEPAPGPQSFWHRFPSREDEVVAVARHICALAEKGVYADEIVVVFPALEIYRPIVERVFGRYGHSNPASHFVHGWKAFLQSERFLISYTPQNRGFAAATWSDCFCHRRSIRYRNPFAAGLTFYRARRASSQARPPGPVCSCPTSHGG